MIKFLVLLLSCSNVFANTDKFLIAPLDLLKDKKSSQVLISDWNKKIHKRWVVDGLAYNTELKNGKLYVLTLNTNKKRRNYMGRDISIYDKNNKLLWRYSTPYMHHAFEILPNGNIAIIRQFDITKEKLFPKRKKHPNKLFLGKYWPDEIVIINPQTKKEVWKWRPTTQDLSEFKLLDQTGDIMHTNSVKFTAKNPITNTPAFLISSRNINQVWLIEFKTKKVIWKSPKNLFIRQHDATFLENGNILVFNNRLFNSSIVEINLKSNKVVWEYTGGTNPMETIQFISSFMGSSQRLGNGNTLIGLSTRSLILEINQKKEVVRRIFTPVEYQNKKTPWPYPSFFKVKAIKENELKKVL